jgi:glycosyltransferase involved in cell wall biosynthesis
MRILHVTDSDLPRIGGIELHVHDLARRQRAERDEVSVATLTPELRDVDPDVIRLPPVGRYPHPAALPALGRLVRSGGYDVVHAHVSLVSPLGWAAVRAAARTDIPIVVTMHSMLPGGAGALALRAVLPPIPPCVVLTAVSTVAAAALQVLVPRHPVSVLPNGIDPGDWLPGTKRATDHSLTIVSTMRTAARKRPLALLQMLEAIRQAVPAEVQLRAMIAGDGPLDQVIRHTLRSTGLNSWVRHVGRLDREQIKDLLHQGDLYLAPARLESFGIAALEARSAGLPVIGMARSGLSDFIRDGRDGFLVHTDAEMVARAAHLLGTPVELRRMQCHNREHPPTISWAHVLELHRQSYAHARQHVSRTSHRPTDDRVRQPTSRASPPEPARRG